MTDVPTPPTTEERPPPVAGAPGHVFPADWPTRAADTVDLLVAAVNDRAVRPVVIAARALVFGVLIGVLALAVLVWLSVAVLRILDIWLEVWVSYLVLGAVFVAVGLVVWRLRNDRSDLAAS